MLDVVIPLTAELQLNWNGAVTSDSDTLLHNASYEAKRETSIIIMSWSILDFVSTITFTIHELVYIRHLIMLIQ